MYSVAKVHNTFDSTKKYTKRFLQNFTSYSYQIVLFRIKLEETRVGFSPTSFFLSSLQYDTKKFLSSPSQRGTSIIKDVDKIRIEEA